MLEVKTERFGLVLSPQEREAIRRLAEQEGVSQATAVRVLIRRAARDLNLWPTDRRAARC